MKKITGLISNFATSFKAQWKVPKEGNYVSYKEIAAYSVGGMGVQFVAVIMGQIAMTAGCLLIGSIYNIKPMDLATLTAINTIFNLLMTPIKGIMLDNTRSKKGKFRPYILYCGIPSVILMNLLVYIPTDTVYVLKVVLIGGIFIVLNFIYSLYYMGYASLVQVMTPNTKERTSIISVSSIVFSMAPTIVNFLLPLIAKASYGILRIETYRLIFPIFSIVGLIIGYLSYTGTKERIVVPKRFEQKVNFFDGLKKITKNKYFWINNVSTWIGITKLAAGVIGATWIYVYNIQDEAIMSVCSLIIGTSSLVGMLIAPKLIAKFGKRNVMIWQNVLFVLFTLGFIFFPDQPFLILFFFYFQQMMNAVQMIVLPSLSADALDFQQWKTGDRLEGFSGNFAILGSLLGILTAYIVPLIFENFGLLENYDILFDKEISKPLFQALGVCGCIGGVLTAIPYLFYDMTEEKHRKIIEDLKERAITINKEDGIEETVEELEEELKSI